MLERGKCVGIGSRKFSKCRIDVIAYRVHSDELGALLGFELNINFLVVAI